MVRIFTFSLEIIYRFVVFVRNLAYDFGIVNANSFKVPIISVGNISTGGTGKTPMTILLVNELIKMGKKPAVVSRGYKRKSKGLVVVQDGFEICENPQVSGDEPYLIASKLNIPVVVDENRSRGINTVIENYGADVVVLDDAFQHRKAHRDIDIVLLDSTKIISDLKLLPSGSLREPLKNLKRADIICFTKTTNEVNENEIRDYLGTNTIIISSSHLPSIARDGNGIISLKEDKVFAFCGIANPDSFRTSCEVLDIKINTLHAFKDHVDYNDRVLGLLKDKISKSGCDTVLTTEKDFVKLKKEFIDAMNLSVIQIKTKISKKDKRKLVNVLESLFSG